MDDIIAKYLSGEASDSEKMELKQWLAASGENRKYFSEMQNVWHVLNPAFEPQSVHPEQVCPELHTLITPAHKPRIYAWFNVMQRVAALLFLPLLGLVLYHMVSNSAIDMPSIAYQEVVAPFGARTQVHLPDGSQVWLNSGAKLRFPMRFEHDERRVHLQGEAYFEVKSSEVNPFVVEVNDIHIRATGTAFNITAFSADSVINITLIHGKVSVTDSYHNTTIMKPNDNLTYHTGTGKSKVEQVDVYKWKAWKEGVLVFRNDRLEDVFKRLGLIYNVDIILKDKKYASHRFRATFENESLDEILTLIMKSTSLTYKRVWKVDRADEHHQKEKIVIMK